MADLKWMMGSDFHIPYAHPRYMDLWWQVMDWWKPDVVDILGDLDDNNACSRFARGTSQEITEATVKYVPEVKEFFADVRKRLPDGPLHFAAGNHEFRYDGYIDQNAPALKGLITPEVLWGTDTYGVELSYYDSPPVHRFGDIYVHHGPYALSKSGDSVRKVLDEFGVSCIVGHSHRQGAVFKTYELRDETLRGYEIGHMTDTRSAGMAYDRKHDWQAGFALAYIENGVYPHIQLVSISPDYTCVVDGKVFRA